MPFPPPAENHYTQKLYSLLENQKLVTVFSIMEAKVRKQSQFILLPDALAAQERMVPEVKLLLCKSPGHLCRAGSASPFTFSHCVHVFSSHSRPALSNVYVNQGAPQLFMQISLNRDPENQRLLVVAENILQENAVSIVSCLRMTLGKLLVWKEKHLSQS